MEGIIPAMTNWIDLYYGNAIYLIIAVFSYLYLFVHCKEGKVRIIYPVLLIGFVIVNPILYKVIFSKIVYWRLLWMLPNTVVIAYAVVEMLKSMDKSLERALVFGIFFLFLIIKGINVYKNGGFVQAQNPYKISNDAIEVCDVMLKSNENPRCIMPSTLYSEVRQYSGEIEMLYGRNIEGYISCETSNYIIYIQDELSKDKPNYEYVLNVAEYFGYDFIVVAVNKPISPNILKIYNYSIVKKTDDYVIYHNVEVEKNDLSGWVVTQYGYVDGAPFSFYTIEDAHKNLIIIDGGYESEYDKLKWIISQYDNRVKAWIITNPHSEHVGGINAIIENTEDIIIDDIYALNINYERYKQTATEYDSFQSYEKFVDLTEKLDNVHYVQQGDELCINNLQITVLNAWNAKVDKMEAYLLQKGSMCLKISGQEESMLFCSDLTSIAESAIIKDYASELDVDYLQVANHGKWGMSKDFYQYTSPKVVFFDSADSMLNSTDQYNDALELKNYFEEKRAMVLNFSTTPNRVFLK